MPRLRNPSGRVTAGPQAVARPSTPAEQQRRYRSGHRARGGRGHADPVWLEPRNGYPWKPYVYRGTGPFDAGELS